MDCSVSFCNKMSKVENLLSIVNNEVDSAMKFLHNLKQHSVEMVGSLRNITSSSAFLKEFLEVNSLLLKYIDFLTEINCKFEILQASDREGNIQNSTPTTDEGINSCKSGSDVKSKNNLIASTILPAKLTLDILSDIISNSTKTSCAENEAVKNHCVMNQKVQNKLLTTANKKYELNKIPYLSDSYPDDEQNVCKEIEIQSPESEKSEMIDEVKHIKDGKEVCVYSLPENGEENFGHESFSGSSQFGKEPIIKQNYNKVESESLPGTGELSITEVLYSKFNDSKRNVNTKVIKDPKSTLTKNYSFNSVNTGQLEQCNDKLYEIKPINISRKIGEEYKIIIEHIISPSEFYVYILQSHLYSLRMLEKKLKVMQKDSSLCKKKESKNYLSEVIGKYALYYSKCDEKWCRAKITDWRLSLNDNLVYIFLLDYGVSKCVTIDEIQPMPDRFKFYPAFIQRCHLSGIYPTEVNLSSKTLAWSKAANEKMKCIVDTCKTLKIKVAPEDMYHPAKSLPVTLWLMDECNSCVNDLLVKSQHAQPARKPETMNCNISESEYLERWNPMKEDFDSYLNSYDLDMADPAAVIYGYVGRDYKRICKHFAKTGKCFKGQSCKKEHVFLNPLGFTTDKEEVYKNAVNAPLLPPPKSLVSVQVTCILSLNLFCCIRDESAWTCEEETLQSLVRYMNSTENIRNMKNLLIPPSVGQLVIAKYSKDSSWYRAKILESQPESDKYSVFFVDYGNKEVMPLSSIRAIEGCYLHLPFQAMQCYIFGIRHNPKVPDKVCMDYLNKRMIGGHIKIEVVAVFPGDHPRLLVHAFDQNENIAADLIAKEYAIFEEELIIDSESTLVPG